MAIYRVCAVDDCGKKARGKNYCPAHYARQIRNGSPTAGRPARRAKPQRICSVTGCSEPHQARGVCHAHYKQWEYHGFSLAKMPRLVVPKQNKFIHQTTGYVCWHDASHPAKSGRTTVVLEHRVVMMEKLGRLLRKGENVHHINGNRTDNRPENLELWVTLQPAGQRVEDLVAYAHEILARYGSEAA